MYIKLNINMSNSLMSNATIVRIQGEQNMCYMQHASLFPSYIFVSN